MRRFVAFAVLQALAVSTAVGSSLHVHEYVGHDHPDHHHGPASHEHHHPAPAAQDHYSEEVGEDHPVVQADSCDPGRHAVAVTLRGAQVPQVHVEIAVVPTASLIVPGVPVRSATPLTDIRVHGPPFDVRIPSRAPPPAHLA